MFIIDKEVSSEIVEKKSKFIATIYYVETKEQAEEKIKKLKKKYHDARHNCSAYRVLEGQAILEKSSDDGEPSGTAGSPMLNILQKNDLVNCIVIVTRYFGGILLGTGGLVRAYSDVTIKAIEEAEKLEICSGREFEIKIEYGDAENVKYYCRKNNINITKMEYLDKTICNLEIENDYINKFLEDIEKRTLNILEYKDMGERYIRKKKEQIKKR